MKEEWYIEIIMNETSLSEKEIREKMIKKKAEFRDLISNETALY